MMFVVMALAISIQRLFNLNEIDDLTPSISGNHIVWEADREIFLATPSIVNNQPISETEIKLYRLINKAFDTGTYLFVGETEAILNNPNLTNIFINQGGAFESLV